MIPKFPNFKPIELSDRAEVNAYTSRYEPYSDFNFNCLWAWDADGKRMLSELGGNLVVRFTDYETHAPFLSFLGENDREETARVLIEYSRAQGLPAKLRLMPEVSITGIAPSDFEIEESRDDFDYLFSVQEHAELPGGKFQKKRSEANRFWREHPDATFQQVDIHDPTIRRQVIDTMHAWECRKIAEQKHYEIEHELAATKRLLETDRPDVLQVAGLFLKDEMLGYAIGESVSHNTVLVHFLKSTNSHKGVTEALTQGYAKYLDTLGAEYMNFESDLGVDYVRRLKTAWRPVTFLKRYNVRYSQ